jgi:hypothetical protein
MSQTDTVHGVSLGDLVEAFIGYSISILPAMSPDSLCNPGFYIVAMF